MSTASDSFEDEYEEYDEFDDEDGDRGLPGLVVLWMGVVMFAAFASIVFIAYQQGIKTGRTGNDGAIPYVAAEPEPVKIANQNGAGAASPEQLEASFETAAESSFLPDPKSKKRKRSKSRWAGHVKA